MYVVLIVTLVQGFGAAVRQLAGFVSDSLRKTAQLMPTAASTAPESFELPHEQRLAVWVIGGGDQRMHL
jgi:hypothetical protein